MGFVCPYQRRFLTASKRLPFLAVAALCAALAAPGTATAQSTDVDASTVIVRDVTLVNTQDMDFGRIIAPRNGRVDMTASDAATCTPNNNLTHLGVCQAAAFTGQAGTGFQVRIRVPPGRRFELTGPGDDLRMRRVSVGGTTGLQFLGRTNRNYDYIVTAADGIFEFHVGGRLLIRNNQAPGIYTGTFTIEADYQ